MSPVTNFSLHTDFHHGLHVFIFLPVMDVIPVHPEVPLHKSGRETNL